MLSLGAPITDIFDVQCMCKIIFHMQVLSDLEMFLYVNCIDFMVFSF